MTSRRRLAAALDKVFPHLLILLYSLGAAVIYHNHWPFRGHGDNPVLDLVDFHYPGFYKALTAERCCMDRGGDGIRPFPSRSVRRCVRTQAVRVRSLCAELSGRP